MTNQWGDRNPSRLLWSCICVILAALTGAYAWLDFTPPMWPHAFSMLLAFIFLYYGANNYYRWWRVMTDAHLMRLKEIENTTPEILKIQALHGLPPEGYDYLARQLAQIITVANKGRYEHYLDTGDGMVPWGFLEQFLDYPSSVSLRPITWYSEGSVYEPDHVPNQIYARLITNHLVSTGFATEAVGNMAAQWKPGGRFKAVAALGIKVDGKTGAA